MDEKSKDCRICGSDSGQYNIFNDELCLGPKNSKQTKIYICLNHFIIYEKLYGEDEHSSYICQSCCDQLCDSYSFMIFVRKAELNNWKIEESKTEPEPTEEEEKLEDQEEDEIITEEFLCCDEEIENDDNAPNLEEVSLPSSPKKPKMSAVAPDLDTIKFTNYQLQLEKNTVFVNIEAEPLILNSDHKYQFDVSFLNHKDDSLIYQCKWCIKAFANSEFLVKHLCSVHFCTICLEVFENYKTLQKHSQSHDQILCPFECGKISDSTAAYRLHLKKQHHLQVPIQIGILPKNFDK